MKQRLKFLFYIIMSFIFFIPLFFISILTWLFTGFNIPDYFADLALEMDKD